MKRYYETASKVVLANPKRIYNEAVRDVVKELWLFDGIVPNADERKALCNALLHKCSYKSPSQKPLKFQQP